MFWVNMMVVKGSRYGGYTPGYLPDNLTSYQKVAQDKVRFDFDRAYSKTWVLMNQLTLITPMPRAWDRTAHDAPANASADLADVPAVYDYLVAQNGEWTQETNAFRTTWPSSPVWSVVNGPWRLKRFDLDGTVTFVPNEHYCGPNRPYLDEFRQVPTSSDAEQYRVLQAGPRAPGALQVGFLPHGLPPEPPEHYRMVPQEIYLINYMLLNFRNPTVAGRLMRQPYIRQALQLTLDQDTAIRDIFHGQGFRTTGPVPAVPDSDRISPGQRGNPMGFDIERARRLLADHGWDVSRTPAVCVRPDLAGEGIDAGTRLSFAVRYAEGRVALTQLMEQFRGDAALAGIELRLQEVNGSVMVGQDHSNEGPDDRYLWELQCWNGGWVLYGHPTGEVLFKTGAGSNYGHYSDEKADELIDRTVLSDDLDVLYEYQDYIAEQVPVIWTPGFPLRLFAVDNSLRGFEPVNPYGMINPENWYFVNQFRGISPQE
jgi:peptide/nickel transport system substrate-binding protein